MPTTGRVDLPAVVVGGGPAGSAFAAELARNGRGVVVLERSRGPHHTVCGEFLSEEAQVVLGSLGIEPSALGAAPITHLRLVKGERQALTPLPFTAASLSRFRLDEALLAAAAQAGADVIRGASVTGLELGEGSITVRSAGRVWKTDTVALAIGKHAMRGWTRPSSPMVGFKLHLEPTSSARDLAGIVQLVFFDGGYVGSCLVEDGILSVAWVMKDRLLRAVGSDWSAQCAHLSRQSSLMGDLLAGARPLFPKPMATAAIPFGFIRTQPIASGVFPVGDQLAVVPPFTGDGMAVALFSGVVAARAALAGKSAGAYQHDLVRQLRPQFRIASGVGRLLETPATCQICVAAGRLLPALMTRMVEKTRLRRFTEIAASLGLQRSMTMR